MQKAFVQLFAGECAQVYGDSFERDHLFLKGIGNNVTLEFSDMDFGETGASRITIEGHTPLETNTIILSISTGNEEIRHILEFKKDCERQTFELPPFYGTQTIRFLFLPGCHFDFHWFRFEK